jgi:hypothetical protein
LGILKEDKSSSPLASPPVLSMPASTFLSLSCSSQKKIPSTIGPAQGEGNASSHDGIFQMGGIVLYCSTP